ncbi:MAG: hypothetical protein EOP48_10840 [Sphingobacteriales bacterium]|nr:MAG: hypothetical protein EOP48_10840 [Sphingobacteriales bacterium]
MKKVVFFALSLLLADIGFSNTYLDDPSFDRGGIDWNVNGLDTVKSYSIEQGSISTTEHYLALYPDRRNEEWGNHSVEVLQGLRMPEGLGTYFKAEMSFSRNCKAYLVNFKVRDQVTVSDWTMGTIRYEKTLLLKDPSSFTQFISDAKIYPGSAPLRLEIVYAPKNCTLPNPEDREFQIDYLQFGTDLLELGGLGNGPKPDSAQ